MSPSNVRKLARLAIEIGGAIGAQAVDALIPGAETVDSTADWPIRKVQIVWGRTSAGGVDEDVAVCSLHFINITSGAIDPTWVTGDFTTIEAALDAWWTTLKTRYSGNTTLREFRWYRVRPGALSGDAVRITARNVPGTATAGSELPPQVAMSITQKVALRRHWGRIYMPAPYTTASSSGMITPTIVTALATATQTLFDACRNGDMEPVVYSPTLARAFPVLQLQVDDLFDVIRSRRYGRPTLRTLLPVA
jgi:hypothetical protein